MYFEDRPQIPVFADWQFTVVLPGTPAATYVAERVHDITPQTDLPAQIALYIGGWYHIFYAQGKYGLYHASPYGSPDTRALQLVPLYRLDNTAIVDRNDDWMLVVTLQAGYKHLGNWLKEERILATHHAYDISRKYAELLVLSHLNAATEIEPIDGLTTLQAPSDTLWHFNTKVIPDSS